LPLAILLLGITALTLAQQAGVFSLSAIAASPEQIGDGDLWLVVSSGLVAQTPIALSLLSFGVAAILVQVLCGARTLWLSAAIGHSASTIVVYLMIAPVALADRDIVGKLLTQQDYGVSAIFAAWLGVVAARIWLRPGAGWPDQLGAIVLCLGAVAVAWLVRGEPAPSVLDTEHLIAFAVGWSLAAARTRERVEPLASLPRRP
jgi:hypothetical protein